MPFTIHSHPPSSPLRHQFPEQQPNMASVKSTSVAPSPRRQSRGAVASPPPPAPTPRSGSPVPWAETSSGAVDEPRSQQNYGDPLIGLRPPTKAQNYQHQHHMLQAPLLSMPIGLPAEALAVSGVASSDANTTSRYVHSNNARPAAAIDGLVQDHSLMPAHQKRNPLLYGNRSNSPPHSMQLHGATAASINHHAMNRSNDPLIITPPVSAYTAPPVQPLDYRRGRFFKSWLPSKNRGRSAAGQDNGLSPLCTCLPFVSSSANRSSPQADSPAILPSWKSPDMSTTSSSRRSDRSQLIRLSLMWIVPILIFLTSIFMAVYANRQITWTEEDSLNTVTSFRCDQQLDRLANEIPSRMLDPARFFQAYVQQAQAINQDALNNFFFGSNISTYLRFHLHPRVLNQDRAEWERLNAPLQITVPADRIFAISPSGDAAMHPPGRTSVNNTMVPRPINASPVYWPVQFASPQRGVSLGFDFYHGPRMAAVDTVLRTGEPVLSNVVYLYMPLEDPEMLQAGLVLFTRPVTRADDGSIWMVSATVNLIPYFAATLGKSAPSARIYAKVEIGGVAVFESERLQPGSSIAKRDPYVKSIFIGQQNITMTCLPTDFLVGLFITGWAVAAPLLTVFGGAGLAWMIATLVDRLQRLRTAESLLLSWRSYSEAILQATPNPMILVNDQGKIAGVNEPLLELTGHTTESIRLVTKLCDLIMPLRKDPDEELFTALSGVGGSRAGAADDSSLPVLATITSRSAASAGVVSEQSQQLQHQAPPPDSTSVPMPPDDQGDREPAELQAIHDLLLTPGRREVLVLPATTSSAADPDTTPTIDAMVTVSEPTGNPVIQHVLVLTDLREQRARDRQLAELLRETELLNAQQRQLLLYLAHELRNPVYVIQGSVQAALEAAAELEAKSSGGGGSLGDPIKSSSGVTVSFASTDESDRAGVLAATEHVTTLLDAVVEYVEASSAAMAVFPFTAPGARGARVMGRGGGSTGDTGTLMRPSNAIAAATLARSTYGRAASALRVGHGSEASPRAPGPVPPPLAQGTNISAPRGPVDNAATTSIPPSPSLLRPATVGLSAALSLADVLSPATAIALNPDWTHLDIGGSLSALPVSASSPRTPDLFRCPPCVQLSRASRHALHKLATVCRAAPGVTLAGWSVTQPQPPRLPSQRPAPLLVHDPDALITVFVALALPTSIGPAELITLSSPFDWSISGQGSEFRLFGLQVAILTRLAELAGGMARVDQANREVVLQVPARPCSWVAQGLPCEGVKAMGEIGLMEVGGLASGSSRGLQARTRSQLQASALVDGASRPRPATPSTPVPESAHGEQNLALTTAARALTTVGPATTTTTVTDEVELQPLLPPTLQACDSAATVIVDQDPADVKPNKPDKQLSPTSPVIPTLVSVSTPAPVPNHHECPSEASSMAPAAPLVVLLVEDNALIQALTKRFLERDGFHVVVADHGQAALDLLADPDLASRVHLVVMDLMMPVLDGIDATRIIRKTRSPDELPIVALTANAMAEERERCLQSGFNAFLTKPVTRQKLIETVRSLWSTSPSPVTTTLAPVQA